MYKYISKCSKFQHFLGGACCVKTPTQSAKEECTGNRKWNMRYTCNKETKDALTISVVRGEKINLYQKLHIQLTESLFAEVLLLLTVFGYLFAKGIALTTPVKVAALIIEVYLTLHILLSIVRSTTHLYCVFYKDK